jgi:hypothetical protein
MIATLQQRVAAKRPNEQIRVLAVVSRFNWQHIDYLEALAEQFDLTVAYAGEWHEGAVAEAIRRGLRLCSLGLTEQHNLKAVRSRLSEAVRKCEPDVVHLMYHFHEHLALLVREVTEKKTLILLECRDSLTTLVNADRRSTYQSLEGAALRVSDAQIFVSAALRSYYEKLHGLNLTETSLLVPHAFAQKSAGPLSRKLSQDDGKVHLAVVGTADPRPDRCRWYGGIIRRLTDLGFVVHSHFHEGKESSLAVYRQLAAEIGDYHFHSTVSFMDGTKLSEIISRYDLMGVFYELAAPGDNEAATLAVCMPMKAVSGWFHGAIPVVCFQHYRGLSEWINEFGIGFVVADWDGLRRLSENRAAIAQATQRCVAVRETFSNEWNAGRIQKFVEDRLAQKISSFQPTANQKPLSFGSR